MGCRHVLAASRSACRGISLSLSVSLRYERRSRRGVILLAPDGKESMLQREPEVGHLQHIPQTVQWRDLSTTASGHKALHPSPHVFAFGGFSRPDLSRRRNERSDRRFPRGFQRRHTVCCVAFMSSIGFRAGCPGKSVLPFLLGAVDLAHKQSQERR